MTLTTLGSNLFIFYFLNSFLFTYRQRRSVRGKERDREPKATFNDQGDVNIHGMSPNPVPPSAPSTAPTYISIVGSNNYTDPSYLSIASTKTGYQMVGGTKSQPSYDTAYTQPGRYLSQGTRDQHNYDKLHGTTRSVKSTATDHTYDYPYTTSGSVLSAPTSSRPEYQTLQIPEHNVMYQRLQHPLSYN